MLMKDLSEQMWDATMECQALCKKATHYKLECKEASDIYKDFAKEHLKTAKKVHTLIMTKKEEIKKHAIVNSMPHPEHSWLVEYFNCELDKITKELAVCECMINDLMGV